MERLIGETNILKPQAREHYSLELLTRKENSYLRDRFTNERKSLPPSLEMLLFTQITHTVSATAVGGQSKQVLHKK